MLCVGYCHHSTCRDFQSLKFAMSYRPGQLQCIVNELCFPCICNSYMYTLLPGILSCRALEFLRKNFCFDMTRQCIFVAGIAIYTLVTGIAI